MSEVKNKKKSKKQIDPKLLQYNGLTTSRKMWKLWNIDKILRKR